MTDDAGRTGAGGPEPTGGRRENPYVGLVPFDEHDGAWFFGREREQRIIGANLRSSRLTLLYGASGVGKSSVLLAAVVPALRKVVAEDRAAREREKALSTPGPRGAATTVEPVRFAVAVFSSWRDAPLDGLMQAVAESVREATGEAVPAWMPGTPMREALAGWLGPVRNLLIVLDQFEEYFLYHPHEDGPGTFAGELVDVVNDPDLRVNFLISLREDGLAKLDRFKGRIPRLFDNYLRVGHLDLDAARRAIEEPKNEYNRRLPPGSEPALIDADLIDTVLDEVRTRDAALEGPSGPTPDAPGGADAATGHVETPLLQLVMRELWAAGTEEGEAPHLRLATLRERLGGTERILYRHLESALGALSDADRDVAVDVLRPLVSPTGTKIAWRPADLAFWAKRPTEEITPILEELSRGERRILRAVQPPGAPDDRAASYEIFHDILADPILEWCGEREAERQRAQLARELEQRQREHEEAERQRRRDRRNRIVRAVALGLAALTIGLVVAVYVALDRGDIADSRGLAARATSQLPVDPERSLLLAIEAVGRRDTTEARQALRRSLSASRVRAALADGRPRPCRACGGLVTEERDQAIATDIHPIAIAPDGRTAAGIVGGRLKLWQPHTGATFAPGVAVEDAIGVAFTPDARRLLVVGQRGSALMAPNGARAAALAGEHLSGAVSPDGRLVVTVGSAGAVVWNARDGRRVAAERSIAYASATFADAGRIVLQDGNGGLVRWRWRTGDVARLAPPSAEPRMYTRYATRGRFAVDGAADGKLRVVTAGGQALPLPPGTPTDPVADANISPDGARIASVRGTTVELWRSERPWRAAAQRVAELRHTDGVTAVVFSADSRLVATASTDGTARVWESSTGELVTELRGHAAGVESLAFSAGGRFVATVGEDLTIRLWDLGVERTLRGAHGVEAVAAAHSGFTVAVVEDAGELKIWNTVSDQASSVIAKKKAKAGLRSPDRFPGAAPASDELRPTSVALAANGRLALAGYSGPEDSDAGRALLVDVADRVVRARIADSGAVHKVALASGGRFAAVVRDTGDGRRVELRDLRREDAAPLWRVPIADGEQPTDVALSSDERRLLVTTVFGAARIFDLGSRKELHALATGSAARPGSETFYRGVFSPDGRTVAVAGSRDVRLWDSRSGKERDVRLSGHTSVLRSVAYSRDGRQIVTASADGTTRVWDVDSGRALAILSRHAGRVNGAAFLPDGSIVSGGEDRTVRVYPCETCGDTRTLLRMARRQVTRDLSPRERAEFLG